MPTSITYVQIKKYLDAIADNPAGSPIEQSPHGPFWSKLSYSEFVNGTVPGGERVKCHKSGAAQPTPIIDKAHPEQSVLYLILTDPNGWCDEAAFPKPQMPEFGPFITEDDYSVTIDGAPVTGKKIKDDLLEWLTNGFPE